MWVIPSPRTTSCVILSPFFLHTFFKVLSFHKTHQTDVSDFVSLWNAVGYGDAIICNFSEIVPDPETFEELLFER